MEAFYGNAGSRCVGLHSQFVLGVSMDAARLTKSHFHDAWLPGLQAEAPGNEFRLVAAGKAGAELPKSADKFFYADFVRDDDEGTMRSNPFNLQTVSDVVSKRGAHANAVRAGLRPRRLFFLWRDPPETRPLQSDTRATPNTP